jgi:hypothetical protein
MASRYRTAGGRLKPHGTHLRGWRQRARRKPSAGTTLVRPGSQSSPPLNGFCPTILWVTDSTRPAQPGPEPGCHQPQAKQAWCGVWSPIRTGNMETVPVIYLLTAGGQCGASCVRLSAIAPANGELS